MTEKTPTSKFRKAGNSFFVEEGIGTGKVMRFTRKGTVNGCVPSATHHTHHFTAEGKAELAVYDNYIELTPVSHRDTLPSLQTHVFFKTAIGFRIKEANVEVDFCSFFIDGWPIYSSEESTSKDTFSFNKIVFTRVILDGHLEDVIFPPDSFVTFHGANAPFREYALKQLKEQE